MSNAWGTTTDDVLNVIHNMGKKTAGDKVHQILNDLNHFEIECEALRAPDQETQIEYAYQEIQRQIQEKGLL